MLGHRIIITSVAQCTNSTKTIAIVIAITIAIVTAVAIAIVIAKVIVIVIF